MTHDTQRAGISLSGCSCGPVVFVSVPTLSQDPPRSLTLRPLPQFTFHLDGGVSWAPTFSPAAPAMDSSSPQSSVCMHSPFPGFCEGKQTLLSSECPAECPLCPEAEASLMASSFPESCPFTSA